MAKYIRTKDRIYEIEDEIAVTPYLDEGWKKVFKIVGSNKCIKEHEILKQADTIEELCDMFVTLENLNKKVWHSINFTLCDDLRKDRDNEGVYGAVWTNKGLIYVAKMNNDGDLELI